MDKQHSCLSMVSTHLLTVNESTNYEIAFIFIHVSIIVLSNNKDQNSVRTFWPGFGPRVFPYTFE